MFDIKNVEKPMVVVTKSDIASFKLDKFKFEGEILKDNLVQFLDDVRLKKVDPYLKSENKPEEA